MSFGEDEEILQDFLVEAGEILELLSEQLVDLEQRPDDQELLNAIFRGFHTVKGGAGFLQLNNMVDCCHCTENLFDILRNGQRGVTPELMDVVLLVLDLVNAQFDEVKSGQDPSPAAPSLLTAIESLIAGNDAKAQADLAGASDTDENEASSQSSEILQTSPELPSDNSTPNNIDLSDDEFEGFLDAISDSDDETQAEALTANTQPESSSEKTDDITDDEFDALLDELHGSGKGPTTESQSNSSSASDKNDNNEITEDEFDALLDQLHGAGNAPTSKVKSVQKTEKVASPLDTSTDNNSSAHSSDEKVSSSQGESLITDDEFDQLLDQLHGEGQGPTATPTHVNKQNTANNSQIEKNNDRVNEASDKPAKNAAFAKTSLPQNKVKTPVPTNKKEPIVAAPPAAEATVRVDTQRLDDIMNMVGELVLVRNRLVRLGAASSDEVMQKAVGNLDVVTADLQSSVMKTRMQPIKKVFGRFPRVVRDLARNLKKEITLELEGEDTDLDKNLVEALADPLVHLVRNSVDHGIELPDIRAEKNKPRMGKIILAAQQEGDHILLSITDDGGGMDPESLREKAIEKGVLDADAAARLSDSEAFNLIFAPGFSTKTEISDVSGRGVGMDVVKTKITQLNGSIEIKSKLGEGTKINIKVPLTLAIMPTLMIMVGKQAFALPLVSVNEIFHMNLATTNVIDGQECVSIRDHSVPIFHLERWLVKNYHLKTQDNDENEGHVVIVSVGTQRVGFIVDQLIGQEEVVIKPLGKMLQGTPGMAGATITGDGTIALILDVPSLLKRYAGSSN